ncbi:ABC transporter substrate-binding protein [Aquimarina sp. Aq107]|uniref:ABC transporter substrate-binding protein n=1 Tax=Aquimarina sp. Aq107 TaxID=1191912 RepID=UPI000D557094|nr:ABC transporter substrate-binding protein [Aquimarina sp. Aq107]
MTIKSQNKIGVLLPQSNTYPIIGKSFLNGLRLAINGLNLNIIIESIGYGSDQKQIINSFQKLCYQENVILTTGILGHNGFKELTEFASQNEEIILAANFGSKRPIKLSNRIFQNSLGLYDSLQLLVNFLLKTQKNNIATSTCYYEAGYGFIEALDDIISQNKKASFSGHYITPLHPRKNESELMDSYFSQIKPDAIVAFHNGVFAKEHINYLNKNKLHKKYPIYTLPFSSEDHLLIDFPDIMNELKTISSWYPELNNYENNLFTNNYIKQYSKKPDFFSLLGYENGLVIKSAFLKGLHSLNQSINSTAIKGPRGEISFNNDFNKTNFNHYIWENTQPDDSKHIRYISNRLDKNTSNYLKTVENNQGWLNTYLCH